jgi:hypothetical protein
VSFAFGVFRADLLRQVKYQSTFKNSHEIPNARDNRLFDCAVSWYHNWVNYRSELYANEAADDPIVWMEPVRYYSGRKPNSSYHRDIDSNGRTNFFTRWWNQPELELHGDFLYRTINVDFRTSDGIPRPKEVHLIEIPVMNTGNDDAFEPEIRAIPLVRDSNSKKEIPYGYVALRHAGVLLSFKTIMGRSQEPDEIELATLFVKEGLQRIPFIVGNTSRFIVFGFTFKGGSQLHLASEDVFEFASLSFGKDQAPRAFQLFAKARNSGRALLCKRVTVTLSSSPEELRLIRS